MKISDVVITVLLNVSFIMNAAAQDKPITIKFTDRTLGEVLKEIGYRYGLNFSYGNDLPALDQKISIDVKELPLHEFLKQIFEKVGAEYKIIDGHVAISEKDNIQRPEEPNGKAEETNITNDMTTKDPLTFSDNDISEKAIFTEPKTDTVTHDPTEPQIEHGQGIKDVSVKGVEKSLLLTPETEKDEQQELPKKNLNGPPSNPGVAKQTAFGFVASLDFYSFSDDDIESSRRSYSVKPNYSIGIYARQHISEKWSIGIQTRLATRNFNMKYNYAVVDSNDPLVPDKTNFEVLCINVPADAYYRLLHRTNLALTLNGGLVFDFLIKGRWQTYAANGDESELPVVLGKVQRFTAGVRAGFQTQYAIRPNAWIILAPTYIHYITPFNKGFESINMRMTSLELGLLFEL